MTTEATRDTFGIYAKKRRRNPEENQKWKDEKEKTKKLRIEPSDRKRSEESRKNC
jgi:hypothetical protein